MRHFLSATFALPGLGHLLRSQNGRRIGAALDRCCSVMRGLLRAWRSRATLRHLLADLAIPALSQLQLQPQLFPHLPHPHVLLPPLLSLAQQAGQAPPDAAQARRRNRDKRRRRRRKEAKRSVWCEICGVRAHWLREGQSLVNISAGFFAQRLLCEACVTTRHRVGPFQPLWGDCIAFTCSA